MARSSTGIGRQMWPIFLLILVLHCLAILLFIRGFLLTRTELPFFSRCSDISQSPCFSSSSSQDASPFAPANRTLNQTDGDQRCWTKPPIDRLVIIVFDALRFDFVAPSAFFEEVLQKLASTRGSSSRIFKAIADPPTTSLQRLKALFCWRRQPKQLIRRMKKLGSMECRIGLLLVWCKFNAIRHLMFKELMGGWTLSGCLLMFSWTFILPCRRVCFYWIHQTANARRGGY